MMLRQGGGGTVGEFDRPSRELGSGLLTEVPYRITVFSFAGLMHVLAGVYVLYYIIVLSY